MRPSSQGENGMSRREVGSVGFGAREEILHLFALMRGEGVEEEVVGVHDFRGRAEGGSVVQVP